MDFLDELKELGVDVDKALEALNGKRELYSKLIVKFCGMLKEYAIPTEFNEGNYDEICGKVHSLKGTSGNLSITPLYTAYSDIMQLLRENKIEQAQEAYNQMLPIQDKIVQCVEKDG